MSRQQTTIRLTEQLINEIDSEANEQGLSRSEYVRELLQNRHKERELQEEIDTLREQLQSREN